MSDKSITRPDETGLVADSMENLLDAERAGEQLLAEAKQQAAEVVEQAYKHAQAIDRRCSARIERLNKASGEKNRRLVEAIDREARAAITRTTGAASLRTTLLEAASRLAARLTGEQS